MFRKEDGVFVARRCEVLYETQLPALAPSPLPLRIVSLAFRSVFFDESLRPYKFATAH